MNLFKRFINWLFGPKEPAYFYRVDPKTEEVHKVEMTEEPAFEAAEQDLDVPLFTAEELKEMKKADLFELAINSGITDVSKKDTKKVLIKKISSYYDIK